MKRGFFAIFFSGSFALGLGACDSQLSSLDRVEVQVGEAKGVAASGGVTAGSSAGGDSSATTATVSELPTPEPTSTGTDAGTSSTPSGTTTGAAPDTISDEDVPTAPSTLVTAADSAAGADVRYDDDNSVFLAWSGASDRGLGLRDDTVVWYESGNCTGISHTVAAITTTNLQLDTLANNTTVTFKVTSYDLAGLGATSACSPAITVDLENPSVAAGADASTTNDVSRTGVVTETHPGSVLWTQVSGPGTIAFGTASAATTTIAADSDGSYVVRLTATDAAGRSGSDDLTFVRDTAAPTAPTTLVTAADAAGGADARFDNDNAVYLAWSGASDGGVGIRDYTVVWYESGNCTGSAHTTTGETGSSLAVGSLADATVLSFKVIAYDNLSQSATSACSGPMTIDLTDPAVGVGADIVANVATTRLASVTEANLASRLWTQVSGPGTLSFTAATAASTAISASAQGTYAVKLTVTDAAGRTGEDVLSFLWDTSPPSAPSTLITAADAAGGADVRYEDDDFAVYFAWSGASDGTGAGLRDDTLVWYSQANCGGAGTTVNSITTGSYNLTAIPEGTTVSFLVRSYDQLNHVSSNSSCSGSIKIDTLAPPALSAAPTGAAGDSFPDTTRVGANKITLDFPADTTDYARVDVRQLAGATAPASCSSGSVIRSLTSVFADGAFVIDSGTAGSVFSYKICIYDAAGHLTSPVSHKAENLRTKAHVLFATSVSYASDLGGDPGSGQTGAARADFRCNALAVANGVNTITAESAWRAIISDANVDALTHVVVSGAIVLADSYPTFPMATSRTDFWDGTALTTPNIGDETNGLAAANTYAWTGSTGAGLRSANHCSSWTSAAGNGAAGDLGGVTGADWLYSFDSLCSASRRLYCLSQAPQSALSFAVATGTGGSNRIALTITPPPDHYKYDDIVVVRGASGAAAPEEGCATGTAVLTVDPVTGTATSFTDTPGAGVYSYRACVRDVHGNTITSATGSATAS